MSWWGKIIGGGFGFLMGGPLGALLGASFGHQFDKGISGLGDLDVGNPQRTQAAFFTACNKSAPAALRWKQRRSNTAN